MSTQLKPFLPFAVPDIGEEEIAEVVDSLRSGWLTTGPKVRRFESDFAEFIGHGVEAVSVNSATAGLHLALEAVGIRPGDEIITTPYTFTATAEVVRYLGAHPVFVDIDPATLNIDPNKLRAAITPNTRAIMPVHFGGRACDMDPILQIARQKKLWVIEDAAHAIPSTYRGKLVGALDSDATVFSFYATKTLACGEGGMVVTRNAEIAQRCRIMRLHGIDRDAFDRYTSQQPGWQYDVVAPGFKYNMTDLAASVGIHQLRRCMALQQKRETMAQRYDRGLMDLPLILPPPAALGDLHAWHLYVIRLTPDAPMSRNEFIARMAEHGIGTSVHFIPLHLHPYWRDTYRLRPTQFPCALRAYEGAVSLPLYTAMPAEAQMRVIDTVRDLLGRGRAT
ncbi:MAG TPA: DegT/DnrJ/EryC1/StrS family aminotransferase [Chthonomonadales bacterium]|nr:DegT/DnrJ/EryC1/StrS family aminotransferase [Chthonomonadales bacterium]